MERGIVKPLTQKEIEGKFRGWLTTGIDRRRAEDLLKCVRQLETLRSMNDLMKLLTAF